MRALIPLTLLCLLWAPALTAAGAEGAKRPRLPDVEVSTLDGRPWRIGGQRGRVLLLHFWSLNCRPCLALLPRLRRLHGQRKKRDEVALVSLPVEDDLIRIRRHVKQHHMGWTQLVSERGSAVAALAGSLGVKRIATPYFWVVDGEGRVVAATSDPEEAAARAEALMRAGQRSGRQ